MSYNEKLQANNEELRGILDTVQELPDAGSGYDEGYEAGYGEGFNYGHDEGYEAGYRYGLDEGHDEGYAAGKQAEYDAFWDAYLQNGNITDCRSIYAGMGWTNDTFKPKYTVKPKNAERMFFGTGITDLKLSGVVDFSSIENMRYFLAESNCVSVDVINLTNATDTIGTVYYNPYLKHIGKIVLKDDGTTPLNTNTFQHCYPLETIEEIVGTIGFSVDFSYSTKLTHDSLMSIINALKDYSGTGTTHTVTLGATNLAKLTDAEKAIATQRGWTLA